MGSKKPRKRKKESSNAEQASNANTAQNGSPANATNAATASTVPQHDVVGNASAAPKPVDGNAAVPGGTAGTGPIESSRDRQIQCALEGTGTSQDEVPETVLDVLGDGGRSLEQPIQRALEERMDADFSSVRVHTGRKAAKAADEIDAKAFTCGNDIVFNSGEYDTVSPEGKHLLAHELAHVTQQHGGAPISMMPKPDAEVEIDPDPQLEREADEAAAQALSGDEPLTISRMGTEVHVQRTSGIMPIMPGSGLFGSQEEEEETDHSVPAEPEALAEAVKQLRRNQEQVMATLTEAQPGAPATPDTRSMAKTAAKGAGGALAGAAAGAALGTAVGGPVGTVGGALVGAVGGVASDLTKEGVDYAADRLPGSQAQQMEEMYEEMAEMYKELKEGKDTNGTRFD